jgi:signal transduction histidine kinase
MFKSASEQTLGRSSVYELVLNLLSNAIKFTPQGRTVRITFDRERSSARIQVHDEGTVSARVFFPLCLIAFGRLTTAPGENSAA